MAGFEKRLLVPSRRRSVPETGFSWIDRRLVREGFLAGLTGPESLLYFFLVAVADQDGLSFYGTRRIGALIKLTEQAVEIARAGLERKDLVVYRTPLYQVLALPEGPAHLTVADQVVTERRGAANRDGHQSIGDILEAGFGPLDRPRGGLAR